MEPQQNGKKREIVAALAVLIVVVAIVAAAGIANKKKADGTTAMVSSKTADTSSTPSSSGTGSTGSTGSTSSNASTSTNSYKDGDYSATGTYDSPGGTEHITIHVTMQNGIITATSAKSGAGDPEAQEYQDDFISGYKQQVVGKNIGSISLSRVSGSSLTSQGFNSAISQIKSEAKQSA